MMSRPSEPLISVVMPAYNCEDTIGTAITSILQQTYTNFEFIIIDDGSTDTTLQVIRTFTDHRIKIIQNKENKGLIYSLNLGLRKSNGYYIARMDADDICLKHRFEKQVKYLDKHKDVLLLGSGRILFGEGINSKRQIYPEKDSDIRAYSYMANPFVHPSIIFRKTIVDSGLSYDQSYKYLEDYKFIFDVMRLGKVANIPTALIKYRISQQQISSKNQQEQMARNKKLRFLEANIFLKKYGIQIPQQFDDLFFKKWCSLNVKHQDKKIISAITLSLLASHSVKHRILKYIFASIRINHFSFANLIRLLLTTFRMTKYSGLGILDC